MSIKLICAEVCSINAQSHASKVRWPTEVDATQQPMPSISKQSRNDLPQDPDVSELVDKLIGNYI